MTKRIEELYKQSFIEVQDENSFPCMTFSKQKFAELIVGECVKFCEHESNDDEHDEYDMGMWVKAESIKTAIMEEFGIKE